MPLTKDKQGEDRGYIHTGSFTSYPPCLFSRDGNKSFGCVAQRDGVGREEGGGFRMGSTCIPVVDSF